MALLGNQKYYFHQDPNQGLGNVQLFRYSEYDNNSDLIACSNLEHMPEHIDKLLAEYRPQSFLNQLHEEFKLFIKELK
jgi:hypothetical protein